MKRGDFLIPSFIRFTQAEFLIFFQQYLLFVHNTTFILTYATQRNN